MPDVRAQAVPGTTLPARRPRAGSGLRIDDARRTMMTQARGELDRGQSDNALHTAETGLRSYPNDPQLRFVRALALNQLGRLPEAESAFLAITQEFPEMPEPYNNLAVVRAAQGNVDGARIALEDSIRAVPGYATAHENLGDVYTQLAARSYREAIKLAPTNQQAQMKLRLVRQIADVDAVIQRRTAPDATPRSSSGPSLPSETQDTRALPLAPEDTEAPSRDAENAPPARPGGYAVPRLPGEGGPPGAAP